MYNNSDKEYTVVNMFVLDVQISGFSITYYDCVSLITIVINIHNHITIVYSIYI